jgi:hypothetical protein
MIAGRLAESLTSTPIRLASWFTRNTSSGAIAVDAMNTHSTAFSRITPSS